MRFVTNEPGYIRTPHYGLHTYVTFSSQCMKYKRSNYRQSSWSTTYWILGPGFIISGKYVTRAQRRFLYFELVIKCMYVYVLFGLLAVVAFDSRKILTVDWDSNYSQ